MAYLLRKQKLFSLMILEIFLLQNPNRVFLLLGI